MNIEKVLKELTLEEKARLCMGEGSWKTAAIERLGIPSIRMADGPHGLRKQCGNEENNVSVNESIPATCFPPASLASCSFNRKLIRKMGEGIADEAILQDVDVVLGPAVNIKRSPLCGRNFEYVSEDPYLSAEYAVAFINGVQSRGVGTSLKHFTVNNQERLRMNIDAVVDERALREIYLYPFEKASKSAKPYTIMASYNRINGEYGCENHHTLRELLRGKWGYNGLVMSDWSAVNDRIKALCAGCDLEMPESGSIRTQEIIDAVKSGALDERIMDEAVKNVLRLVDRCRNTKKSRKENVYENNHSLARQIASESAVLLKNENAILPLDPGKSIALIGAFAEHPRFQGGGSSHITPTMRTSMKDILEENNLKFTYSRGYDINSEKTNDKLIAEAVKNASNAHIALIFIGLTDIYEFEGLDRKDMSIPPSHIKLLNEVYKVNQSIAVVLCAGSAVDMAWEEKCRGILYAGLVGQAGSEAIYDILFGRVNPSGRLSETFSISLSDTPCYQNFPGGNNSVRYAESIYVGYRFYSTSNVPVRYPFGYGLSYTSFEYLAVKTDREYIDKDSYITLKVRVRNTGPYDGAEVIQIYIKNNCNNTFNPHVVLKNFEKVCLKKGEERDVVFTIGYDDFTRYDVSLGWVADSGDYLIFAGKNSRDLQLGVHIQVAGDGIKQASHGIDTYFHPKDNNFDELQFKTLYGKELPHLDVDYKPIGINTPLEFCSHTLAGKLLFIAGKWTIAKSNRGREGYAARKALTSSLGDNPIRSLVVMNDGTNLSTGYALVKMMTGKLLSGLKAAIRSLK